MTSPAPSVEASPPRTGVPGVRLALPVRWARADRLNGAWWPYSLDLSAELGLLVAAVTSRLGRIRGVLLTRSEWPGTPVDFVPGGSRRIRISWYGEQERGVAALVGNTGRRVDLLVVPPQTPRPAALAAMTMACAAGNTLSGAQTLRAAGLAAAPAARPRGE